MKRLLIATLCGGLFGLGLAISGMTDPDKVLNFLDLTGRWDPSLAVVMAAALAVSIPGFAAIRRRDRARFGASQPPPPTRIDARLILGSALFGVGWGIAGYCPGPALANLSRTVEAWLFVAAMIVGSQLARRLTMERNGE